MTPIMGAACRDDLLHIVQFLADKSDLVCKDRNDRTILHLAAERNQYNIIQEIQRRAPNLQKEEDQFKNIPLHTACRNGFIESVEHLGHDPTDFECKTEDEKTPLHLAAENGHNEVVEFIISKCNNV